MNIFWHRWLGILLLLGILSSIPAHSLAAVEAQNVIKFGTIELGIQSGYWQAFTGLGNAVSSNRSAVFVLPQIGVVVTDKIEAGYFSGAIEVLAEPVGAHFFEPFSASLAGFSIVGRYNFLAFGRLMPYWDFGMGVSWTDLAPRIPEQSTPFEFLLETGPGLQYFLTQNFALTGALRLHHISNANIGSRNTGINAVLGLLGVSYYFD
ncbi:acyloxyacyl hydrolase [Candidatus Nitronereus thalassa]|uniref:Acyloxyacyl hydrolase n=1 Tax=Candidatus Nitronereus thalassa TaxID=3020898 RepID=A0ABU3KAT7_9BACT|nr:acyloxyacyl hydrolase [Candidatus Nitronereus thalassa]MDT7043530.1 acyloxyacyl hydrolase [Candidatus Nitronereus thalassa]